MRQAKAGDSIFIRPAVKNMQILEKELAIIVLIQIKVNFC
jgi:hypothetical protein